MGRPGEARIRIIWLFLEFGSPFCGCPCSLLSGVNISTPDFWRLPSRGFKNYKRALGLGSLAKDMDPT